MGPAKKNKMDVPFLIYYLLLVIGMLYTNDAENGLFTLNKKIVYVIFPIVAATEGIFYRKFLQVLKRSFVYSCLGVILLCLERPLTISQGGAAANFDFLTYENLKYSMLMLLPHGCIFSYIQFAYWAGFHPGYLSMY